MPARIERANLRQEGWRGRQRAEAKVTDLESELAAEHAEAWQH